MRGEYEIFEGTGDSDDFSKLVASLMAEGWQPQGGVCVIAWNSERLYSQAMVRYGGAPIAAEDIPAIEPEKEPKPHFVTVRTGELVKLYPNA